MSTFYATFDDDQNAMLMIDRLLRGGVRPEDLSLLRNGAPVEAARRRDSPDEADILMAPDTVGDATAYVGREDDPEADSPLRLIADISVLTTVAESRITPIDTSTIGLDVETVDQSDDSQREAELWMTPTRGIPQGAHEMDDLALTVTTGFPTRPPEEDDVRDVASESQEQATASLEVVEIPGFGTIYGGGELATAALDFARPDRDENDDPLVSFLTDDGVPEDDANRLSAEFRRGNSILGVLVTPGEIDENALEENAAHLGARNASLYDAPRYTDGGGQASVR